MLRIPLKAGERDRASRDKFPSIGGPAEAAPDLFLEQAERPEAKTETEPVAPKRTPAGKCAEKVEIKPPAVMAGREEQGWRDLRDLWQRGWAGDDTPKAQAIARNAFAKACREVEPGEIIEAAKTWVAAADAPRYLPQLSQWLAARGWETPPPIKRGRARANGHKAQRSNGYAKPDMFKIVLEAGGYREDADGNLYWPGDGAGDDEPLCTSMWRAGS